MLSLVAVNVLIKLTEIEDSFFTVVDKLLHCKVTTSSVILLPTALKSPAAFHEQRRSLERARVRYCSSPRDLKYPCTVPLIAMSLLFL